MQTNTPPADLPTYSKTKLRKALVEVFGVGTRFKSLDMDTLSVVEPHTESKGERIIVTVKSKFPRGRAGLPWAATVAAFKSLGLRTERVPGGLHLVPLEQPAPVGEVRFFVRWELNGVPFEVGPFETHEEAKGELPAVAKLDGVVTSLRVDEVEHFPAPPAAPVEALPYVLGENSIATSPRTIAEAEQENAEAVAETLAEEHAKVSCPNCAAGREHEVA